MLREAHQTVLAHDYNLQQMNAAKQAADKRAGLSSQQFRSRMEQEAAAEFELECKRGNSYPKDKSGRWKDWALGLGTKLRNQVITDHDLTQEETADFKTASRRKKQSEQKHAVPTNVWTAG